MNPVHYSSKTVEWATPQAFYDHLDEEFGFKLDVCATDENAKCERYFTVDDDGLAQEWTDGPAWMNPPYGRGIDQWVAKAWRSSQVHGTTVVCLLPARVDTKWWHDYCMKGEVRLLRGRLAFGTGEAIANAPFPNAVVVFGQNYAPTVFSWTLPIGIRGRRG